MIDHSALLIPFLQVLLFCFLALLAFSQPRLIRWSSWLISVPLLVVRLAQRPTKTKICEISKTYSIYRSQFLNDSCLTGDVFCEEFFYKEQESLTAIQRKNKLR